jgi:alkylhydroperoxidase/carboxymuconolactone decarboxylase family protein YurZ
MPEVSPSYFAARPQFKAYFDDAHAGGTLNAKTKELMHLAVVLAVNCEP